MSFCPFVEDAKCDPSCALHTKASGPNAITCSIAQLSEDFASFGPRLIEELQNLTHTISVVGKGSR